MVLDFLELHENNETHRVYNYRNKILKRKRNNSTGNYELYKQFFTDDTKRRLKNIYGGNGDISNISSSFLLKFPNAKYSDISQNVSLKGQLLSAFKTFDSTGVLSTFEIDTNAPNETELSIYINVSWESSDSNAETQANALITAVKNNASLTNILAALPVPSPFDVVQLDTSLDAITIDNFVVPTIHSLVTTYNSGPDNTDIEVKTVGLYDHIGIKINSESDNEYRRLRTNGIKTLNISGVNPYEDIIIATLFNHDYKPLYTSIQSPIVFVQQTQGTNGDLLNEAVDGSITLNLDHDDFITNNQSDFITTMNAQTGGFTIVINVYAGSAIVKYRVIFNALKTQQEIDAVVTKLNNDTEIQNIINTSGTMNGVTSVKTVGTTTKKKGKVLTLTAGITDVKYDGVNTKIIFHTIGSYKNILYKATGQETFLSSTKKSVDLPPGFTNQIDVKLTNINDDDITTIATYTVDTAIPIMSINGSETTYTILNTPYVDPGVVVTDNIDEEVIPVITGTVDHTSIGVYTIVYTATDSSNNTAQKTRVVKVLSEVNEQVFTGGQTVLQTLVDINNFIIPSSGVTVEGVITDNTSSKFTSNPINGNYSLKTWYGNSPFYNNQDLTDLDLSLCTNAGHDTFRGCTNLATINMPICTAVLNDCFKDCPGINTVNMPLVETIGNDCFINCQLVNINMPKLKYFNGSSFSNNTLCNYIDWRGLDYVNFWPNGIRNTGGNSSLFTNYPNNGTIYVPIHYKFSNGGNVDGDLQFLSSKGWTINYIDYTPPVITLNGSSTVSLVVGDSYSELGVNVTDNSGETLTPVITSDLNVNKGGTYTVTYTATDSAGNSSSVNRTIQVKGPYIDLISSNFKTVNGGPGSIGFPGDRIDHGNYQSLAVKKTSTIIDYTKPFRIIYKIHWTTTGYDSYVELGFATTNVGQSYSDNNHYIIFEEQNIRYNGGITVITHNPISGGVNSNFYNLNTDRYVVITYDGTYNYVEFYNQSYTLLFSTKFTFYNHYWTNGENALYMYLNKNGGKVYGIYASNNTNITVDDAFGPGSPLYIDDNVYSIPMELGNIVKSSQGTINEYTSPARLENTSTNTSWGLKGESYDWVNFATNPSWKVIYDIQITSGNYFIFSLSPGTASWYGAPYHGQESGNPLILFIEGNSLRVEGGNPSGWYTSSGYGNIPAGILNSRFLLSLEKNSSGHTFITFYNRNTKVEFYKIENTSNNYIFNNDIPFAFTTGSDGVVIFKLYAAITVKKSQITFDQLKYHIPDISSPNITLNGNSNIELIIGDAYTELGATATDDVDGNITGSIVVTGSVDTSTTGNYTLTYTATDNAGNSSSVNRTVIVKSSPLVFTFYGDNLTTDFFCLTDKTIGKTWPDNDISKSNFDLHGISWVNGLSIYFHGNDDGGNNNQNSGFFSFGNWDNAAEAGPGVMRNQDATYARGTNNTSITIGGSSLFYGSYVWLFVYTPNSSTTATLTVYKNGTLSSSNSVAYDPNVFSNTNRQVRLGNIQRSNSWTGYIKNVKIWNAPVDWATADSTPMS